MFRIGSCLGSPKFLPFSAFPLVTARAECSSIPSSVYAPRNTDVNHYGTNDETQTYRTLSSESTSVTDKWHRSSGQRSSPAIVTGPTSHDQSYVYQSQILIIQSRMDYSSIPKEASLKIEPFKVQVSDDDLQHFHQLLGLSRLAPQTYENGQSETITYGVTYKWMTATKHYWENQYDWRAREAYFNAFPNFMTSIKDDQSDFTFDIHFAALFSEKPDAIPLVFLHGWPGSFLEFLGVLEYFRSRYRPADLPFHVIVPSLPGYTLSSGPPTDRNFKVEDIASVIDKLMTGLGFKSYAAQGGDIGSYTCRALSKYPACKAVHLNFSLMDKPDSISDDDAVDEVEKQGLKQAADFGLINSAYALEHGTKPATIGFVLDSSPIALLAWIGEKFLTWTDETPSTETILDSITLYWFTKSFSRCIFPYRQFHGTMAGAYYIHKDPKYRIDQPLGYSYFPKELAPMPKSWVAATGNLVWSRQHDCGGHFAAMEKPNLLAEDMESFIKQVW